MRKRIAASLAAAAMGASTLVGTAPAFAEPAPVTTPSPSPSPTPTPSPPKVDVTSVKVSPGHVVIRGRARVAVTATVETVAAEHVKIAFEPLDERGPSPAKAGDAGKGVWKRTIVLDRGDPDGRWLVHVEATGANGVVAKATSRFYVKHVRAHQGPRATRLGFDASPEPVKKGRKLTLAGKLEAARCYSDWWWDGDAYVIGGDRCRDAGGWHKWRYVGRQDVDLYFHRSGGKWKYVGTVETERDGSFATKIRAYGSGTWKAVFTGARGLRGSSDADYVKVVR
ncbi:hypothetical protein [Sphaerisporangium sp. TRM90804]|uniref:hypothetical protein n=1 Tax=Sphaerisporangium sp. TRM90804 TaxID=3031113 RepID=UPI00244909DE|nr:hypothetical protein [Sphaerisporangium sp. TRM90804]MDH2430199.1 hypothetical protein [Sphaerisporangium sp. TRM90804]